MASKKKYDMTKEKDQKLFIDQVWDFFNDKGL